MTFDDLKNNKPLAPWGSGIRGGQLRIYRTSKPFYITKGKG